MLESVPLYFGGHSFFDPTSVTWKLIWVWEYISIEVAEIWGFALLVEFMVLVSSVRSIWHLLTSHCLILLLCYLDS